jgi:hypothetical protein
MMFVALVMLVSLWLMLTRTRIGLVIQERTDASRDGRVAGSQRAGCSCWCSARALRWPGWPGSSAAAPSSPNRHGGDRGLGDLRGGGVVGGMGSLAGAFLRRC